MSQYSNQSLQPQNPNPQFPNYPTFSNPPPIFDPFLNSGLNPPNYSSFPSQPINYFDPHLDSSSWVVKQSAPIKYPPAVPPLNTEVITSTSYEAPMAYNLVGQRLVNRVPKKKQKPFKAIPKKPSVSQSVRCELCKIECNNVHVYEKHLSGRKHSKGLLNLYAPALKAAAGGEGVPGDSSKTGDLEIKKQKLLEGGVAVQSLRICTICNVACNGEVVYSDHVAGKKHIAKERALGSMANSNPISGNAQETNAQSNQTKKRKKGESSQAWCDVCKISCTSNDGLQTHLSGKKHQKNLQKLQNNETTKSSTGASETTDAAKPPKPRQAKKKGQTDDVNVKKQKILESGTSESALRMCTICNVVCNSDTVFKSHLDGKIHAAMVKQAEGLTAGLQTVDPAV